MIMHNKWSFMTNVVLKNIVNLLDDLDHVTVVTRNHSKFLTSHSHSFAIARRAYWQVATYDYLCYFNNIYNDFSYRLVEW